jgi:hypothetical protein
MKKFPGYILVFSMLTLAGLTAMATYLVTRTAVYAPFVRTIIDREKAKLVALGGVQVAMAQLARTAMQDESQSQIQGQSQSSTESQGSGAAASTQASGQPEKAAGGAFEEKFFLTHFLPVINRWQEYQLKEEIEGIDSTLRICLMCEEGKININQIYNYAQKQFYGKGQPAGDWEKILQELFKNIERIQGGKDLFKAFESFLKKQEYKLIDVTQLLLIPEFEVFRRHQFYNPPSLKNKSANTGAHELGDNPEGGTHVYLTDIFTVESGKKTVNPWVFSAGIAELLQLKNISEQGKKELTEQVQELLKSLNKAIVWKNDWTTLLKPIYQKELQSLPKGIESVFDTSTTPRIFSVISQARVGSTMQKLFVILERTKKVNKGKTNYAVSIKKLYWL